MAVKMKEMTTMTQKYQNMSHVWIISSGLSRLIVCCQMTVTGISIEAVLLTVGQSIIVACRA